MTAPANAPETLGRRAAIRKWLRALAWNWIAIVAASLFAAAAFAAIGEDVFTHELGSLDGGVRSWVLEHQSASMLRLFTLITQLGSTVAMVAFVLLVGVWLWRNKHRHVASIVVTAPAIAVGLFNALKAFFQRHRPEGASKLHVLSYSFPSGHTTVATAVMVTVAYVLARERMVPKWLAIVAAIVWPILVGASRVYLDVHWTTDVLGGWALGLLVAGVSAALYERARARIAPAPPAATAFAEGSPAQPSTADHSR
ncbi:MAG: phosphatase PAP2 family protein [Gemmatimonadota bacterium]|nr:phosphatase PAP2 family protein [Gemmatimonadota bacterium]